MKVSDEFTDPMRSVHRGAVHRIRDERRWWARQAIDPLTPAAQLWAVTQRGGPEQRDAAEREAAGDPPPVPSANPRKESEDACGARPRVRDCRPANWKVSSWPRNSDPFPCIQAAQRRRGISVNGRVTDQGRQRPGARVQMQKAEIVEFDRGLLRLASRKRPAKLTRAAFGRRSWPALPVQQRSPPQLRAAKLRVRVSHFVALWCEQSAVNPGPKYVRMFRDLSISTRRAR